MLDYDAEAATYDDSRGGEARAAAVATAVEQVLPTPTRMLVDVACGTGIVTRRLRRPDREVVGLDRSAGMLALAARRLPDRVLRADATRLPMRSESVDAVLLTWLLHLLDDAAPVLAECTRVLRPGGRLITTVDKDAAGFSAGSDIASLTAPIRRAFAPEATDRYDRVLALGTQHGLRLVGETSFAGTGQGHSPRRWRELIGSGRIPWCRDADPEQVAALGRELSALPGQDVARPDPQYRLIALS